MIPSSCCHENGSSCLSPYQRVFAFLGLIWPLTRVCRVVLKPSTTPWKMQPLLPASSFCCWHLFKSAPSLQPPASLTSSWKLEQIEVAWASRVYLSVSRYFRVLWRITTVTHASFIPINALYAYLVRYTDALRFKDHSSKLKQLSHIASGKNLWIDLLRNTQLRPFPNLRVTRTK